MADNKENISDYMKTMKARFEKCLSPTMSCQEPAIAAHSVQNATAMALIAEKDHVYEIRQRVEGGEQKFKFQKVGRNQASTFSGFCSKHDTDIFLPIDTKALNANDQEQLFLIAYRSVTRELHAVMEAAHRLQKAYTGMIASGRVGKDEVSAPAIAATQHMLKAWGVWKHRYAHYDAVFVSKKFGDVQHSVFLIEKQAPIIACSSFFSVDDRAWGKRFSAACLNIIPTSDSETAVIISYPKAQSGAARRYVAEIFTSTGDERMRALSHLVLNRVENFFVSPRHLEQWSAEKRQAIERAYIETVTSNKEPARTPELFLF